MVNTGTGSSSLETLAQTIPRANTNVERVTRLHDETGILVRSITGGGMQKHSDGKQKNFGEKTGKMKTQKKAKVKKMIMVVMMTMMTMRKKKKKWKKRLKRKKKKYLKTTKELQMCMTCDSMQPPGSTY